MLEGVPGDSPADRASSPLFAQLSLGAHRADLGYSAHRYGRGPAA